MAETLGTGAVWQVNNNETTWQQALSEAFSSVEELCGYLQLDLNRLPLLSGYKAFPLKVPRRFAELMEPGNPDDPLLLQVLPLTLELLEYPDFINDAVGDLNAVAAAGVLHKYHGRALLVVTGACAVNCRYCFRRNFPYSEMQLSGEKLQQAVAYIHRHAEISEVILSGGDPLLLNDNKFGHLLDLLGGIPHLARIRIHSRTPVVLPSRITQALIDKLTACRKQMVVVLHANHPRELSADVAAACSKLSQNRITLLNQSVLLKRINDDCEVLCRLSERLFACGILPYYLHALDHAAQVDADVGRDVGLGEDIEDGAAHAPKVFS